jgi:hypothetical protein
MYCFCNGGWGAILGFLGDDIPRLLCRLAGLFVQLIRLRGEVRNSRQRGIKNRTSMIELGDESRRDSRGITAYERHVVGFKSVR